MKLRKAFTVGCAAIVAGALMATAAPAAAAPERVRTPERRAAAMARTVDLLRVNVTSNNVVLNGDAGCANRVRMTAVVNSPFNDPERVRSVSARLLDPDGDLASVPRLSRLRVGQNLQYTGFLRLCGNDEPGRYRLVTTLTKLTANNNVRRQTVDRPVWLKRPTTLTYNASPEPVQVGGTLTHAGRLMFDPVGPGGFFGPANQRMTLQFQAENSSVWQLRRIFFTGPGGFYNLTTTANQDGTWRVNYPSNDFFETQNKTDFVDTVLAP